MKRISELTEKTAEVRSSDGKQIGAVEDIIDDELFVDVYVGERAISVLPKHLIHEIKKKTVHLSLSRKEFEKWWKNRISEYLEEGDPETIRKEITMSFDENFGSEVISALLRDKKCAFCGSSVTGKERFYCRSCRLFFIRDDLRNFVIPKEQREKLCDDQLKIRQSFSGPLRNMLHADEWIYQCVSEQGPPPHLPSLEEDVLLVTSRRVIRYRWDGTEENNWKLPIDDIASVLGTRKILTRPRMIPYWPRTRHLRAHLYLAIRTGEILSSPSKPRPY
ncbi:MAG: hypothetical protein ACFFBS_10325, partial [Promethearchaeota archaeon]